MTDLALAVVELSPNATSSFYYGSLPGPLAKRTKARAERIQSYGRQTIETYGKIGQELLEAQGELEHGLFLAWVGGLGLSKSAAYRAMDVAKNLASELPNLGSLPVTIVQEIGSSATPELVRKAILAKIQAGEPIKPAAIKSEIQTARHEAREKAEKDRKAAELAGMSAAERKSLEQKDKRQRRTAEQRAREDEERADVQDRKELLLVDAALEAVDFLSAHLAAEHSETLAKMIAGDSGRYFSTALLSRHNLPNDGVGWRSNKIDEARVRLRIVIENRERRARGEPLLGFPGRHADDHELDPAEFLAHFDQERVGREGGR